MTLRFYPFFLLEISTSKIKPLAVCDFNNRGTCGWKSEETDLGHRWSPQSGSLCLNGKVTSSVAESTPESASWFQKVAVESSTKEIDIITRFKSPTIPANADLKCLTFEYSIKLDSGRSSSNPFQNSASLSLLQQQKGYLHSFVRYLPLFFGPET